MSLENEWHLDRRVTLALIFMLFLNSCGVVWSAATLKAEVLQHRKELDRHEMLISNSDQKVNLIKEKMARIETNLAYQTKMIERIEKKLE